MIPDGWRRVRLVELAQDGSRSILGGPFGSKLVGTDYVDSGVPVIRGANLPVDRRFSMQDFVFVTEEKVARDLGGNLAFPGDVIVTQRGTLGQVGLIPDDSPYETFVVSQSQMKITVDPGKADQRFIYYLLRSPQSVQKIKDLGMSSGVPHINLETLRNFEVLVPDVDVQRRIADLLGAFDDLIERNRRRIEILEDTARLIYREWFVRFRFPGHEDVDLIESYLGLVPIGWHVAPVGSVCEVLGGGTPSRKVDSYWQDGTIAWYTPSDLTKNGAMFAFESRERITEAGLAHSSAKLFPEGSVMMTSRATIGELAIATTQACTNQGFIVCVPSEKLSNYHLYFWIEENLDLFLSLAGGATFKELRRSTFRELPILVPPTHVEAAFVERVGPMGDLVRNLSQQNKALREGRDLLLPRIVTGDLDVSELDLNLEPVE